ncbi:MAG TPA: SpoIIE family protein phosphatase [Gemmatimonadaceae bacterium]|nr:SpoIIE family protein phosphatase [Gemmatimonadaceae bacterium]
MEQASLRVPVTEPGQVGEARQAASAMAMAAGFGEEDRARVAVVATEAAANVLRHAGGGELVLRPVERGGAAAVEVMALDRGPGIADADAAGVTAERSVAPDAPLTGLGAIARLSERFDLYSAPGQGTALIARVWARTPPPAPIDIGAVSLPRGREPRSGDAWSIAHRGDVTLFMVADGVGHGPLAAAAAAEAARIFHGQARRTPREIIEVAHAALRSTRGASMAVALVIPGEGVVRFAGIGSVGGAIFDGQQSRPLATHNGIVGHELRRVHEEVYPLPHEGVLILHSGGIAAQSRIDDYPGLASRDPSLIAGVMYRDFGRNREDVTVVVARLAGL